MMNIYIYIYKVNIVYYFGQKFFVLFHYYFFFFEILKICEYLYNKFKFLLQLIHQLKF